VEPFWLEGFVFRIRRVFGFTRLYGVFAQLGSAASRVKEAALSINILVNQWLVVQGFINST
jgi:hypothetical protein